MAQPYVFSRTITQKALQLSNFKGVDLTNPPSEVELFRSPDSLNLTMNQGGNLEKRQGIKLIANFNKPVIFIKSVSVKTSIGTITEFLLVQSSGKLKYYLPNGKEVGLYQSSSYLDITGLTALSETIPVDLIPLDADGMYYLITSGGLAKPTVLKLDLLDETTGSASIIDLSDYTLANYDTLIKTPITQIGRSPDGLISTSFEQKNMLSKFQEQTFLADGISATFVCSNNFDIAANTKVWVKTAGVWVLKTLTTHYTLSASNAITFTAGNIPPVPTIIGEDTVKIRFLNSTMNLEVGYKSTVHGLYGFGGLRNYMFLSGYETNTKALIPMEYWAERKLPLYFGEDNNTTFPAKVIGYNNFGEYQSIHCEKLSNEPTVYLRNNGLDASGEVIFPLKSSVSGVSAISKKTFATLQDEPLWLSEYGVMALTSSDVSQSGHAEDRGYYIQDDLLTQPNLNKACGFVFDNKYYLFAGANAYVADPRYKYAQQDSFSGSFQYEWFKWTFMNKLVGINGQTVYSNRCYLAADNGIYLFKEQTDTNYHQDEISNYADLLYYPIHWSANSVSYVVGDIVDYGFRVYECVLNHISSEFNTPIISPDVNTYWIYSSLKDDSFAPPYGVGKYYFGSMVFYQNNYYVCKRYHTSKTGDNPTNTQYWVLASIYTEQFSGNPIDKYQRIMIPITAYWTTPILNMGDITVKKTLKNIWVRLTKHASMKCVIYYSTQTSEISNQTLDYSTIDFSKYIFSDDTDPTVVVSNRAERKFMSMQFKIESDDKNPFGLLEIVAKYTINNQFKG